MANMVSRLHHSAQPESGLAHAFPGRDRQDRLDFPLSENMIQDNSMDLISGWALEKVQTKAAERVAKVLSFLDCGLKNQIIV